MDLFVSQEKLVLHELKGPSSVRHGRFPPVTFTQSTYTFPPMPLIIHLLVRIQEEGLTVILVTEPYIYAPKHN